MALDDILTAIRAEADDEVWQIRADQVETVVAIRAATEVEAREAERAAASSRDLVAEREVARIVNRAALEADQEVTSQVELAYQEAVDALRARLGEVRGTDEYRCVLERMLDEGLRLIPDADGLRVDPEDEDMIRSLIEDRGRGGMALEATLTCTGGVELFTDDGRVVRNTFESRLDRAETHLRRLAAEHIPDPAST